MIHLLRRHVQGNVLDVSRYSRQNHLSLFLPDREYSEIYFPTYWEGVIQLQSARPSHFSYPTSRYAALWIGACDQSAILAVNHNGLQYTLFGRVLRNDR